MKKEHKRCLKRIAAAALVMLMVSGSVPFQPIAEVFDTAIVASADSGVSDWSANDSLPTTAGSYKLTTDITLSSKWEVTEDITLDLNGHGIIRTGGNGNAIRVKNNATLTINDSGNTIHYFNVVDGIAKNINDESGEQRFTGGYITGGTGEGFNGYFWGDGGGVYVLHGNCIMNGGTLLGNSTVFGGGAEVYDGTFTLNGGKIAYNGGNGAVVVRSGSSQYNIDSASTANFVMNGGEISNNKYYGLSRYYCYGESSVTLNAGKICNNGGGGADVYNAVIKDIEITGNTQLGLSGSKITLSGSPVITGNGGDTPKNLVVNIDNPVKIEKLGDTTNIGVTMNNPGVFTSGYSTDNTADPSNFFTADDTTSTFVGKDADGEAKLGIYIWTASFNANDGSGTMDSTEVQKGKSFNLPACTFTAPEGKLFLNWTDGTNTYNPGDSYTMTADTEFTAQYETGKTATFSAGEGSGNAPESFFVLPGTSITIPGNTFTAPEGKVFNGWSDGTDIYNAGAQVTLNDDITFTAQWTNGVLVPKSGNDYLDLSKKTTGYSIPIYDNGGPNGNYANYSDGYLYITIPEGKALRVSGTVNTESGYDYLYVYGGTTDNLLTTVTGENKELEVSSADSPVIICLHSDNSYNKTGFALNAVIRDAYSVTFYANNGTYESNSTFGASSYKLPSNMYTAPEGKIFNGWLSSDDNKVYQAGTQLTLTANTTFTAQWVEGVSVAYGLSDSYGDGWNGNQLIVREKGSTTPIATLTLNSGSSSSSGSLELAKGKIYELVWVKGSYSDECSFNFKDPYSDNVFTASSSDCSNYTDGQVITTFYPPECYISSAVVTFDYMHIPYTSSEITPHFTVKLDGKELIQGTDYEITDGGSAVGDEKGSKQTLTISGIGNYTGTASAEWYIDEVQSYTVEVTNGTVKNAASAQYKEKTLATVVGNTDVGGWYINDKLVSTDKTYSFYVMEDTVLEWKDGAVESNGIANMSISDRINNTNGKVTVTMTSTWNLPEGAKITKAGTYRCYVGLEDTPTVDQLKAGTFKASTLKTKQGTFYFNLNMGAASAAKKLCGMTYVQYTLNGQTHEIVSGIVTSSPTN